MSYQSLRHFVLALFLGLIPLLPPAPAQAAANSSQPLSAARVAAIRDSGPPVMDEASKSVATTPLGKFVKSTPTTATPAAAAPAAVTNTRLYREVFGFAYASSIGDPTVGYPSWNMSLLSTVAYFGLHVDWTGGFSDDSGLAIWNDPNGPVPGLISTAHASGTKVVLTIIMMDSTNGTPNMCSALQRGSVTIANTVAQVNARGIDGVNIDYESNNSQCTDPSSGAVQSSQSLFTAFVRNMRSALPSGSYVSVDTYSGSAGYRSGSTYYGFFDITSLAVYVDSFFVMAYDMEYSNWDSAPLNCPSFCIGPTAPLTTYLFNDTRASTEYTAVVAPSKVIMGVPYYGRKECVAGYSPANAPANAVGSTTPVAEGYLDTSTEQGYYANSGYTTHRETRDAQGSTRWDTFTNSVAQCTRELYWDDVTALGNKYDLVINDHLRGVGIWTLSYGGGAPELWNLINLKFGQCSRAAISADHSVPQIPGTSITFTGSALCAGTGQFRFWISPPSGGWTVTQPYGTANTWTWNTTGLPLGTYRVEVDARNLGSSVSYDTYAVFSFRLALCNTPTLSTDKPSPQLPNTPVSITASVTCQGTPLYQFLKQPPGGTSSIVQDYGPGSAFAWSTAPGAYGTYNFTVNVKTSATTAPPESSQHLSFVLASCIAPSLVTDKASPQPTGTPVNLSGSATCDGPAQFRFQVQAPGGVLGTVQDFGATNTYAWNAGGPGGTYGLELDAKSATAPASAMWSTLVAYELTACSAGTIAVAPASPQVPGTAIQVTAGASCPGTAQYRFVVHKPDGTSTVQDYGSSATYSWNTTGLPYGSYVLEADERDAGGTTAYETKATSTFAVAAPACTVPTLGSDRASPQGTGAVVTFSSTTTTCPTPLFKFWVQTPDATWHVMQDYSATSTFKWSASGGAGTYRIEVDARDVTRPVQYDQFAVTSFVLTACTNATLSANKASPQMMGTAVTFTGGATCAGTPQYRFFQQSSSGWSLVRDYGPGNTLTWTGNTGGNYTFEVDVRDVGAAADYETYKTLAFTINSPCASASLSAAPASSAGTGTTVTLTGSASGCPTPNYRFWVGQNGFWHVVQDYGAAATYSWSTSTQAAGTYGLEVDVRNQGSTASYEKVANLTYSLAACTAASLSVDRASPQPPGTTLKLTGGASCPGTPEYRFWVGQNGIWSVLQDYSASNSYSWNTTGKAQATYGLEVDVRNHGSAIGYDRVANLTYQLAIPPCAAPSFAASPATQAGTGAHVTLTASTSGCPTPQYRFWISPPGHLWSIVQDYSATSTYAWTTTGAAGTYRLEVDVRDQTSSVSYDKVANITYTLVPCSAAHLATDRVSPQKAGIPIVLTGSATCLGTPEYRFWVGQNGIWHIAQDFGPSNALNWNTTSLTPGTYGLEVDVRNQGGTAAYETVSNLTFTVT